MRPMTWLAIASALVVLTGPMHAERPDCALFPDMHARFACYDNVSRAPSPEPADAAKPSIVKPKATAHHPKPRRN